MPCGHHPEEERHRDGRAEGGRVFGSGVAEVLVVLWVVQVQVHALIILFLQQFEGRLLLEVESIFTDSESNFQLRKVNELCILNINT